MKKVLEAIKPFRMPIIVLGVFLVLYLIVGVIVPNIQSAVASKTPIVSIEATNDTVYSVNQEVVPKDFKVTGIHEDGKTTTVSSDSYEVSTGSVDPIGSTTTVTITMIDDPETEEDESLISCDVDVSIAREALVRFQCGYPNVEDVEGVLYSNGELCFEGHGDTLTFESGNFPWKDYDGMDSNPVRAVTFEEGVQPLNMDYWFSDIDTLIYVGKIPSSVVSMVETFEDCDSLTTGGDWSECTNLLNITSVYEDCDVFTSVPAIPSSVTNATRAFAGCVELLETPDTTNATSLVNASQMFIDCKKLISASIAPNATDISEMFRNNINLKDMPEIPASVTNMDSTFDGDISLMNLTLIPDSVEELSNCFANCQMLTGNLTIEAVTDSFGGMFSDAAVATSVNLVGSSPILHAYANTCDSGNITVNGEKPDENITSYDDAFPDTEEYLGLGI